PEPLRRLEAAAARRGPLRHRHLRAREPADRVPCGLQGVAERKAAGEDDGPREAAVAQEGGQQLRVVAAIVADQPVVRAEAALVRGDAEQDEAALAETLAPAAQDGGVVLHVLEQLEAADE